MRVKTEITLPKSVTIRFGRRKMTLTWRPRKRPSGLLQCLLMRSWRVLCGVFSSHGKGFGAGNPLLATALSLSASFSQAAPVGGQVTAGSGQIVQSGSVTTITQSSQNLSLNWNSFNIAKPETVNFVQPSAAAVAVNRIVGGNGTQILGNLNANGQVYLINPHGILFGQGSQVNVGGMVASTLNLSDASLSDRNRIFSGTGTGTGSIVNQGRIRAAQGGYVALLGNQVSNQGTIVAPGGTVALGAGSAATLTFADNSLLQISIDESVMNSIATNGGLISADGGVVVLTAGARDSLLASTVNNSGVIEARTMEEKGGVIRLLGGMAAGTVNVGGTLDASAPNGGDGGFIDTSAATVKVAPDLRVTTAAARGKTGTWLIDPSDYTIAAAGGDITGTQLSSLLGSTSMVIQSTSGSSGTAGDINVNDVVAWSANQLTLNAHRNIIVNANLNASGTASLAFEYGQGALAAGNTATYNIAAGAKVNLPAGDTFTTKLGSDGALTPWKVITLLGNSGSTTGTDLQGMNGNPSRNYVLGGDINASATSGWESGDGFTPVGNPGTPFTGIFDGLGHVISNLHINRTTSFAGLFGYNSIGSAIRNVGLTGGSVTADTNVGGLVGYNFGTITNSYNTGSVSGASDVGGLAGRSDNAISRSYASGNVSGGFYVGGLVGRSFGAINDSYATGNASGTSHSVGGLAGYIQGEISNSYASGNVSGIDYVGGLAGRSRRNISNSHASGSVTGTSYVGGLVGYSENTLGGGSGHTISGSHATGSITGTTYVGGLVGSSGNNISTSYATTGTVTGTSYVGGLVGHQTGSTVTNSYAMGNVAGSADHLGGLIGYSAGNVSGSHATGSVTGATANNVGGLIGSSTANVGTSYATGTVTGNSTVGGLIGNQVGAAVSGSHATGGVTGTLDYIGGLIGSGTGNVSSSYASGVVVGRNYLGGLMGESGGAVSDSYATGNANGSGGAVGGLIGLLRVGATVTGSHASGNASATFDNAGGLIGYSSGNVSTSYASGTASGNLYVGGLIGNQVGAAVSGSHATGGVTGLDYVGGLVGYSTGAIGTSYSSGNVSGRSYVGGLIGRSNGSIAGSHASGSVSGTASYAGGLSGMQDGPVTNSYATGNTSGGFWVGGLIGYGSGAVNGSYASGNVTGTGGHIGGLVGEGNGGGTFSASNSYATGNVTGNSQVGGLAGSLFGSISYSYATGSVSGTGGNVGGLVGLAGVGMVTNSYWDTTTTGRATSAGGGTGLTTAQMRQQSSFSGWDFNTNWISYSGYAAPFLRSLMTPLTVTANAASKTYDGQAYSGGNGVTYSITPGSNLINTISYTGTSQGAMNAGTYGITAVLPFQQGYLIDYVPGVLTVNRATLTASVTAPSREYNGDNIAAPTLTITGGLVNNETVSVTALATFNSKNVVDANLVTVNSLALTDGLNGGLASNYVLAPGQTVAAHITPKAMMLSTSAADKTYDGTDAATANVTAAGFISGELFTVSYKDARFSSASVGDDKLVAITGIGLTPSGSNRSALLASNYSVSPASSARARISAGSIDPGSVKFDPALPILPPSFKPADPILDVPAFPPLSSNLDDPNPPPADGPDETNGETLAGTGDNPENSDDPTQLGQETSGQLDDLNPPQADGPDETSGETLADTGDNPQNSDDPALLAQETSTQSGETSSANSEKNPQSSDTDPTSADTTLVADETDSEGLDPILLSEIPSETAEQSPASASDISGSDVDTGSLLADAATTASESDAIPLNTESAQPAKEAPAVAGDMHFPAEDEGTSLAEAPEPAQSGSDPAVTVVVSRSSDSDSSETDGDPTQSSAEQAGFSTDMLSLNSAATDLSSEMTQSFSTGPEGQAEVSERLSGTDIQSERWFASDGQGNPGNAEDLDARQTSTDFSQSDLRVVLQTEEATEAAPFDSVLREERPGEQMLTLRLTPELNLPAWLKFNPDTGTFQDERQAGEPSAFVDNTVTATRSASDPVEFFASESGSSGNESVQTERIEVSLNVGAPFRFAVPDRFLIEAPGPSQALRRVRMAHGKSWPSWLFFDRDSATFSARRVPAGQGSFEINAEFGAGKNKLEILFRQP